ncbi:Os12g0620733 [Oryza sativa Japonica Group]|uniref:Os12g0620733 protein n=1 Tax=Oryza sativa subsp. japonica TaxID=39947 RepID=A0A0P0YCJ5_ORYSJ|nr:Os12g0620733 [Oryza sativa Japonica Group]
MGKTRMNRLAPTMGGLSRLLQKQMCTLLGSVKRYPESIHPLALYLNPTEKARSHGWKAAPDLRCDVAVNVSTLSNSSSHATAASAADSSRVRLLCITRRSDPSGDALGPFHLTSTATFASATGDELAVAVAVAVSPSARRTTSLTRNFLAGGGHGHILATINPPPLQKNSQIFSSLQKNTRFSQIKIKIELARGGQRKGGFWRRNWD